MNAAINRLIFDLQFDIGDYSARTPFSSPRAKVYRRGGDPVAVFLKRSAKRRIVDLVYCVLYSMLNGK
ncbi:MAG: hypothetical protein A2Y38_01160 [Spirochaetes bacterium GWB1_59_5]|nr:MAG: hypothetical protein A2Y38_01160 [Spirochaetes bacterium GWB1_59_5]